jgi:hypothetical protein
MDMSRRKPSRNVCLCLSIEALEKSFVATFYIFTCIVWKFFHVRVHPCVQARFLHPAVQDYVGVYVLGNSNVEESPLDLN